MTTLLTRRLRTSALNTNIVELMALITIFATQTWARLECPMLAVYNRCILSHAIHFQMPVLYSTPYSGAKRFDTHSLLLSYVCLLIGEHVLVYQAPRWTVQHDVLVCCARHSHVSLIEMILSASSHVLIIVLRQRVPHLSRKCKY